MRLFIGFNLPKKHRAQIHRATRALRARALPVRWIEPENFHVTLKFLGEVRPDRVSRVEDAMRRVGAANRGFSADLAGFGAFPTVRRPRVIWLGMDPTSELRCLKQDLEWTLGELGFEVETRAFHPHVTLGRAEATGGGVFRDLDAVLAEVHFRGALKVNALDLMRSHLSRTGPRYSVVSTARLAAA